MHSGALPCLIRGNTSHNCDLWRSRLRVDSSEIVHSKLGGGVDLRPSGSLVLNMGHPCRLGCIVDLFHHGIVGSTLQLGGT